MKAEFDKLDPESSGKVANGISLHKQTGTKMLVILIRVIILRSVCR